MHSSVFKTYLQCTGVPEICGQLEEEGGYVCTGYMCILVKVMRCSVVPYIYGQLEGG